MSWTRKLLPQSLRARLILSFGVLIFVALFLAGATTVFLLRDQQERNAREKVGLLALPVAQRAAVLEATGARLSQIQALLEEEYSLRILLIDADANVVADTGGGLSGVQLEQLAGLDPIRPDLRYRMQNWRRGRENLLLFLAPQGVLTAPNGSVAYVPSYRAIIAVPEGDISSAWRELLPRLFFAGGVAFIGSVVAASLLARGITRPLSQITRASEQMAAGHYDQQIPAYSGDEVGRLSTAFNNMAREVSRSHRTLREFLANVSHELKTPLTSIQGFSQAMVDGAVQEPQDFIQASRIINDEAQRMRGLVDDLLYISQVEAGEVVMLWDYIDGNQLLNETYRRFAFRASERNVRLNIEADAGAAIVRADQRRLEQALANIVENAIRHTPAGGQVSLRSTSGEATLQLSVHNTGSLIPPEALPHLFDRFFQVTPAQARVDGNSGLGLAITREIVELHGGSVSVSSTAEAGTEFVISLPLSEVTNLENPS